ncbi:hypothetical protein HYDPIDRAFT_28303 [Hydnomerulius pinastri MD-312]|uniref:DUF6533 domain-containing protein n=1 Tax=Hydnomerulius pinastri MD-312 TaxID=994086 RepID=A0A0C9WFM4_9AGAM|nr:hypothetical protein HYDPIDRAFT_28303 [Hydnomerulius pinastri MD-312]
MTRVQSAFAALQLNNYFSVAMATAVTYDYILTFPREIEHKMRPWAAISMLFLAVRYLSFPAAMIGAFYGSSFVSGPNSGTVIFLSLTDLTMVMRVYAMYSKSRIVLAVILMVYIPVTIILIIFNGIFCSLKTHISGTG